MIRVAVQNLKQCCVKHDTCVAALSPVPMGMRSVTANCCAAVHRCPSCHCCVAAYAGVPCSITAAAAAVGAAVSWTATARRCHAVHRCHRAHRTACQSMCVPRCSSMRLSEPCPSMSCSPASPCQRCPAVVVQSCFAGLLVVGISSHHGRMSLRMVFDVRMLGGIENDME